MSETADKLRRQIYVQYALIIILGVCLYLTTARVYRLMEMMHDQTGLIDKQTDLITEQRHYFEVKFAAHRCGQGE